jgi:hypothetical protein
MEENLIEETNCYIEVLRKMIDDLREFQLKIANLIQKHERKGNYGQHPGC